MDPTALATILESPLAPAPPADTILTEPQWETLLAIADTIVPSVKPKSSGNPVTDRVVDDAQFNRAKATLQAAMGGGPEAGDIAVRYLSENATSTPEFKESICRVLGKYAPQDGLRGISIVMKALNLRPFSLLLTGYATPFQSQPLHIREEILRGWGASYLPPLRQLHRSFTSIFSRAWIPLSPTVGPVLGFPRIPTHGLRAESFPYQFLEFTSGNEPVTLETDVVIVGSGCGAGVAAKNLSEAGHRVLVVEKGYHFSNAHYPMTEKAGVDHMFDNGGALLSDDGSVALLAGSTWGGGGTVNWSASLQTQSFVRQEWADKGLAFFTSLEFQNSLDRVCEYMGVSTDHIKHNHGNRVLLEGARKLGYPAKAVPQNTAQQEHYCGYCTLGCAAGRKHGPAVSFLTDAARAGAKFIEGFEAEKVLFAKDLATGVEGTWSTREFDSTTPVVRRKVIINAKKVVVSCGTLRSPLLLLRSGLKNPQIGRNLHIHPVAVASAVFDQEVLPWEGGILTSVVNEFENLDGQGHGSKIETVTMIPSFIAPLFPQKNGLDYKLFAAKMRNMNGFISLSRDKDTGRVYPDPVDGKCRIQYTPSAFDRKHILEGIIGIAKIAYVSGAKEIHVSSRVIPPFIRPEPATSNSDPDGLYDQEGINNAAFQEWIKKLRTGVPLHPEQTLFASAHQMGTCRMGSSPNNSVVDAKGKLWGAEGLYIADASVFPSASGVNPMITNMAISDYTTRHLAAGLKRDKKAYGMARL